MLYTRLMVGFTFSDEHGLWSRISYYQHPDPKMPDITLLPMVHLGEPGYYKEIKDEMWCHDTAYLEGCFVPSKRGLYILHRIIGFVSGLALQSGKVSVFKRWRPESKVSGQNVFQERTRKFGCDCGQCYQIELRMVRADLHRFHAAKAIKAMPLWSKLVFPFMVLAAIISAPFINLRKFDFEEDDEGDEEEEGFLEKLLMPFKKFVIDDRDLFLAMVLAEEITNDKNQNKKLCVKYGAKHMPALADTLLSDFDYELTEQRNVLAIGSSKEMDLSEMV